MQHLLDNLAYMSSPAPAAPRVPQVTAQYWTPQILADVVSVPYALLVFYFAMCGFSIGNYVGYFRYHTELYGSSVPRAYLAFVVVGTGAYILFSSMMWLWAAKYSPSPDTRAQRLQWGIWVMFLLKDLPLFIVECHVMIFYGWDSGYQGFVFIMQCIAVLWSFAFTWLSFTWRTAEVLQMYFGSFSETTLKTGAEQVLIFTPPQAINREPSNFVPSYPPSGSRGGSPLRQHSNPWLEARRPSLHNRQSSDAFESYERDSEAFGDPAYGPAAAAGAYPRYSPPASPLERYSNTAAYDYRGPDVVLPARREPVPSPWDRRASPPSPSRSAMMAYDNRFVDPARVSGFSSQVQSPMRGGFVVERQVI